MKTTPTPDTSKFRNRSLFSVIDVGTTAIRTIVVDALQPARRQVFDTLIHPLSLGQDTFTRGALSAQTIETAVEAFEAAKRSLLDYGIPVSRIHAFATTAVREAANRDTLLDRIFLATGIDVRILEVAEVTRYTYWSLIHHTGLKTLQSDKATLVVEAGGGSTEVLALARGRLLFSHTYGLGTLRLGGTDRRYGVASSSRRDILLSQIERLIASLSNDLSFRSATRLIALGGDMRFAGREIGERLKEGETVVSVAKLRAFADTLLGTPSDELVRRYHLSYADAETAAPALTICACLASAYRLPTISIHPANMRDGLALAIISEGKPPPSFERQTVRSALEVARKYNCDKRRSKAVEKISEQLFDALSTRHRLDSHHRLLLRLAAILHDIGHFVDSRSHHKHAMYLIRNTEIFGMSERDIRIVSLLARYHRRSRPKPDHIEFSELDRVTRMTVCQLASILRIADAIAYTSARESYTLSLNEVSNTLNVEFDPAPDNHLTGVVLFQKGDWFMDLYGIKITLKVRER